MLTTVGALRGSDLRRETIRRAPAYEPGMTIDRAYEAGLFEHYRRPKYWEQAA